MKKYIILLYVTVVTISINAQNHTLRDYVHCINNSRTTPIEYIFKLFEYSDIVVIGERDHCDTPIRVNFRYSERSSFCQENRLCIYRGLMSEQDKGGEQFTQRNVQK
jgi:hypothetical protein